MKSTNIHISTWFLTMALASFVACTLQETTPISSEPASVKATTPASDEITTTLSEVAEPTVTATPIPPTPSLTTPIDLTTSTVTPTLPPLSPWTPTTTAVSVTPSALETVVIPPIVPTPNVVEDWLVYENDFFDYRFSYPPEARIRTLGVTAFPIAEQPENMTAEEYLEQLEETYPDNLCVSVQYMTSFVAFVPSSEKEGKYTGPCGVTGIGDYDVVEVVDTVLIDGETCTASGWKLYEQGESTTWQGEFYFLKFGDNMTIHYGSLRGTHEQFLNTQATLRQIVTSFRSERDWVCHVNE